MSTEQATKETESKSETKKRPLTRRQKAVSALAFVIPTAVGAGIGAHIWADKEHGDNHHARVSANNAIACEGVIPANATLFRGSLRDDMSAAQRQVCGFDNIGAQFYQDKDKLPATGPYTSKLKNGAEITDFDVQVTITRPEMLNDYAHHAANADTFDYAFPIGGALLLGLGGAMVGATARTAISVTRTIRYLNSQPKPESLPFEQYQPQNEVERAYLNDRDALAIATQDNFPH